MVLGVWRRSSRAAWLPAWCARAGGARGARATGAACVGGSPIAALQKFAQLSSVLRAASAIIFLRAQAKPQAPRRGRPLR